MRIAPRVLAVTGLLALALSGCTPDPPPVTLPPSPTTTPLFASEEEALAAAEEAYAAYRQAADEVGKDGWQDAAPLEPLLTPEAFEREVDSAAELASRNVRQEGDSEIDGMSMQSYSSSGDGATVSVYVCVDVSNTRLIDSGGDDVTPPDRETRIPLEVGLVAADGDPLRVDRNERWSGPSFC